MIHHVYNMQCTVDYAFPRTVVHGISINETHNTLSSEAPLKKISFIMPFSYEPRHEKNCFCIMRKQRRRSAAR